MRGAVTLMCDNLGFVFAWKTGHSRDLSIYTMSKLVNDVAAGLGAQVMIVHTGRRTSVGDKIVDHLSKDEMDSVEHLSPGMKDVSDKLPKALGEWIKKPVPRVDLGRQVLTELSGKFPVKLGRDYRKDLGDMLASGRLVYKGSKDS